MTRNLNCNEDLVHNFDAIEALTVSTEYIMCAIRDIHFGEPLHGERVQNSLFFAFAKLKQSLPEQ